MGRKIKKNGNPTQSKFIELKKKLDEIESKYKKFIKDHESNPYTKEEMKQYKQFQLQIQSAREAYIDEMDRLSELQRKLGELPPL